MYIYVYVYVNVSVVYLPIHSTGFLYDQQWLSLPLQWKTNSQISP